MNKIILNTLFTLSLLFQGCGESETKQKAEKATQKLSKIDLTIKEFYIKI